MSRRQQRRRAARRHTHAAVASGGLAIVASLGTAGVAQAANTYTVTNLSDCSTLNCGSLREAAAAVTADASDKTAPGDTIVFASNVSSTIALSSNEIYVGNPVQIIGPGAGKLTIHAAPTHRIFYFNAQAKVSGLTLTGGAVGSVNSGGAVYGYGTLELDSVVVSGNSAKNGGGVDGYTNVVVNDSTITGNTASATSGSAFGGGIDSSNGSVTVNGSTVSGNASAAGAGLASVYGTNRVTGSTVAANTITPGAAGGQLGAFGAGASVSVQDSIVGGSGAVPDVVLAPGTTGTASFSLIRNPSREL